MMSPDAVVPALRGMAVPIAIWCVLSSLQAIAVRPAFAPGRPLGRDLAILSRTRAARLLASPLGSPGAALAAAALRLLAGVALPFVGGGMADALLLAIVGATAIASLTTGGSDGADKMALVACGAAVLMTTGRLLDDRGLCLAGLVWGTGQLALAYLAAGAAKLARPFWRDGTALAAAMTSHRSGHRFAAAIVRHRVAALLIAWAVMLAETLFPLALFAPPAILVAMLAALMAFHLGTAILMGLNTYPWAFAAAYPCAIVANALIVGHG